MPRHFLEVKGYDADSIWRLLKKDERFTIGMRLYAVYLVSTGLSSRKLEDLYQTSFKQITNWVHQFERGGVDGLRDRKGRGRKMKLSFDQLSQLKKALCVSPVKCGYDVDFWTGPLVADWIKRKHGVDFKRAQVYNIIKGLGFTYKSGKGICRANL